MTTPVLNIVSARDLTKGERKALRRAIRFITNLDVLNGRDQFSDRRRVRFVIRVATEAPLFDGDKPHRYVSATIDNKLLDSNGLLNKHLLVSLGKRGGVRVLSYDSGYTDQTALAQKYI